MTLALSRRNFLGITLGAGTGLVLGVRLAPVAEAAPAGGAAPDAFIHIAPDGVVTVMVKHLEMGQGVNTGLPAIVAEELSVPWASIRAETAPSDPTRYGNLFVGPIQMTGGSTSTANSWMQLRRAAAAAREMLVAAAAKKLGVPPADLTAENGLVVHAASGRKETYGKLAVAAAKLPIPQDPALKDPTTFTLIGKDAKLPRTDTSAKSTGKAIYAGDVRLPGMVVAVIARPPSFGDTVGKVDKSKARAVKGVRAIVPVPTGIAVIADNTWAAMQGRDALLIDWVAGPGRAQSTPEIRRQYTDLLAQPGASARADGDAEKALANSPHQIAAVYEVPYLAHAPMEPLTCVVRMAKGKVDIWAASQQPTIDQMVAAKIAGVTPDKVEIHSTFAGGSFGRRSNPTCDYIAEAVEVARRVDAPVRVQWTREDDIHGGYYRPFALHAFQASLDESGLPKAWRHRIVSQSILKGTPFEAMMVKNGIDTTSTEGAATLPYAIPNLAVELHTTTQPVSVLWWRSVGHSGNGFVTESFIDELAHLAGQDPVAYRRGLLANHPRHRGVLDLAADKAGWGKALSAGRARGVAVHESFNSFVAQVAEVSVDGKGGFRVEKIVCAVDCGFAVTPDQVRAQMEGGIAFGLGAALHGAITLADGKVEQSNFHDYPVLRLSEMPEVEVHIVPSAEGADRSGRTRRAAGRGGRRQCLVRGNGKRIRTLPIADQLHGV